MRSFLKATTAAIAATSVAGAAHAAEILVTSNISTSTTWTSDNTYNLQNQIYVLPGASLTIEAGTVVASTPTANGSGALAVARGAQIFVNGTAENPVIMTSTADVATWVGGDPRTGTWREAANEWGNLTVMGRGYISENAAGLGNTSTCDAGNVADMEGLQNGPSTDRYGGGDDDDDSGSISYLSLRYGGRVVGLANELNGLSLGGIGRGTDIHHVEIMNNVDDGVEIWGGAVNLKHISIWNIGDDSFDVDQGWRGKAQFILIVQGWSLDAPQGSGVGDNGFETDGAEDSDWQPVTTATIYNATVIGQPQDGDGLTAWRDNARVQYRNSIFMDAGDELVRFDNVDGDGANGYGHNGTLSWLDTWATAFDSAPATPNDCPAGTYLAQTSGNLAEITDSVFYNPGDITDATAVGVFDAGNNNVTAASLPINAIVRDNPVVRGGRVMEQVLFLDPRAANDAVTSVGVAPNDGFFSQAGYRGAFAPGFDPTWLCGWTASDAFGFTSSCSTGEKYCVSVPNITGSAAVLTASGDPNTALELLSTPVPNTTGQFFYGPMMLAGGTSLGDGLRCVGGMTTRLLPFVNAGMMMQLPNTASFSVNYTAPYAAGLSGTQYFQHWFRSGTTAGTGSNSSDGVAITF